ncbi:MAG: ferrochelatase [bacterium]
MIAPFQFLADHLEILYDIDIAAKQQAEEVGLSFHRMKSLNTFQPFIESMGEVVLDKLRETDAVLQHA